MLEVAAVRLFPGRTSISPAGPSSLALFIEHSATLRVEAVRDDGAIGLETREIRFSDLVPTGVSLRGPGVDGGRGGSDGNAGIHQTVVIGTVDFGEPAFYYDRLVSTLHLACPVIINLWNICYAAIPAPAATEPRDPGMSPGSMRAVIPGALEADPEGTFYSWGALTGEYTAGLPWREAVYDLTVSPEGAMSPGGSNPIPSDKFLVHELMWEKSLEFVTHQEVPISILQPPVDLESYGVPLVTTHHVEASVFEAHRTHGGLFVSGSISQEIYCAFQDGLLRSITGEQRLIRLVPYGDGHGEGREGGYEVSQPDHLSHHIWVYVEPVPVDREFDPGIPGFHTTVLVRLDLGVTRLREATLSSGGAPASCGAPESSEAPWPHGVSAPGSAPTPGGATLPPGMAVVPYNAAAPHDVVTLPDASPRPATAPPRVGIGPRRVGIGLVNAILGLVRRVLLVRPILSWFTLPRAQSPIIPGSNRIDHDVEVSGSSCMDGESDGLR
ncbi:MAG TPA: hypothetical protein GX506_11865 [Firmicutes bacterium]|nr:hypothetical protein [Bacillota bacterium]